MIILAVIFFILLVVIHEYGHFLVARKNGVEVEEFGIGFPPRIKGKVLGKGIFRAFYSINWLPLGGFVRLKGESDADNEKGSFGAQPFGVKLQILLAGVAANFVAAILIFTLLALFGIPKMIDNQFEFGAATKVSDDVSIAFVQEGSPAEQAGLTVGDNLVSIAERTVTDSESVGEIAEEYAGQTVEIRYQRGGELSQVNASLNEDDAEGFLGVQPMDNEKFAYGMAAPVVGAGITAQLTWLTYDGLFGLFGNLFTGNFEQAGENVAGPVGIFVILSNIGAFGFAYLFYFIAVISLTLAVMNSLPIPALDGGRAFVSGIFKLLKKPLSKELEQKIHGTGFALLMLLILLITYVDIGRIL